MTDHPDRLTAVRIRPEAFLNRYRRDTPFGRPTARTVGAYPLIARSIVRSAYPLARLRRGVNPHANPDEHWVGAVSHWVRRNKNLRANADAQPVPVDLRRLERMLRCPPIGYKFTNPHELPHFPCGERLCIHCHARRAIRAYKRLVVGLRRKPADAPAFVAGLFGVGKRYRGRRLMQKLMPAGAVVAAVPPYRPFPTKAALTASPDWKFRVVALGPERKLLQHHALRGRVYPVRSRLIVASACAVAFGYPAGWARCSTADWARNLALHRSPPYRRLRLWEPYGAASPEYTPGQGLYTW